MPACRILGKRAVRWLDDDPEADAARAEHRDAQKTGAPAPRNAAGAALQVVDARPPEYSDESLARRFAAKHANDARYVAAWAKWLLWSGSQWQFDNTMRAFDMARTICRVASAEITDARAVKLGTAIASAKTVAATLSLARADRRQAATAEQWDAHPWLLNTPGGVVDLNTGTITPHDLEHYHTKITAVAPGSDYPLWQKFLTEITANDVELQAFLQRIAGYALTGSISEHALFFSTAQAETAKAYFSIPLPQSSGTTPRSHPWRRSLLLVTSDTLRTSPDCGGRVL
jgi:putative DNA primase/helicase